MTTPFQQALQATLREEGGYQNLRSDPGNYAPHGIGGGTNFGITQRTYDEYRESLDQPYKPVRYIAPSEVRAIYEFRYWRAAGCPTLVTAERPLLAAVTFDWAVHGGVTKARTFVQAALRVTPDGVWGTRTLDALSDVQDGLVAAELMRLRAAHHWVRCRDSEPAKQVLIAAKLPQKKGIWPTYSLAAESWLKGFLGRCRRISTALGLSVHPSFADGAEQHPYPTP